jgi:hypothetical protein
MVRFGIERIGEGIGRARDEQTLVEEWQAEQMEFARRLHAPAYTVGRRQATSANALPPGASRFRR